jgi:hypothetical protein
VAVRQVIRTRSTIAENEAITAGLSPPLLFPRSDAAALRLSRFPRILGVYPQIPFDEIGNVFTDTLDGL